MLTVIIIVLLVLILFGSARLPALGGLLGRGLGGLRGRVRPSAPPEPPAPDPRAQAPGPVYTAAQREYPGGQRQAVVAEILPPDRQDRADRDKPSADHRV